MILPEPMKTWISGRDIEKDSPIIENRPRTLILFKADPKIKFRLDFNEIYENFVDFSDSGCLSGDL